jgi:TetR/AcrR family transcriptional regulator, transcriptional repressor for nem operon
LHQGAEAALRYSPEQAQAARRRVLDAAGRAFRVHGFGGVGVDGLAQAAGLTSGAFYAHFRSKAAAFRAVVAAGIERLRLGVEGFKSRYGDEWFDAFAAYYLGSAHRGDVAGGCAVPSLSAEVARADEGVRAEYETELKRVAEEVAAGLGGGLPRQAAWPLIAQLAGGVLLARAVADKALAEEIAAATLTSLRKQGRAVGRPPPLRDGAGQS